MREVFKTSEFRRSVKLFTRRKRLKGRTGAPRLPRQKREGRAPSRPLKSHLMKTHQPPPTNLHLPTTNLKMTKEKMT